MAHDGGTTEEGRAAARDAWREIDHTRYYGAAEVGNEASARRQLDRIGAIVGGFAVVLLMVGLAQVAEMDVHRSGALGRESRLSAAMTRSLGRRQPARKQSALASLQAVATAPNATDGEGATAAPRTNQTAQPAAAAPEENSTSECCPCKQAAAGAAGQEAQRNTTAFEAPASTNAARGNVSVEPAAADSEPEGAQVTAASRGRPFLQSGRKLLQDDGNVTAFASVTDGNDTASQVEPADPQAAGVAGACCSCSAHVKERQVEVEEDWSSDAMPRNAWDNALSLLTYIGTEAWGDGYENAHKVDGDRVVPKPVMPEHQTPWIGPRDIMVPALEFQGTLHNSGWTIPSSVFGDGRPRGPKEMTAVQKDLNSYTSDIMVDQRITHMKDPANVRGRQLPSVFVDWSRIPHPAEASKEGDLVVSVCGFSAQTPYPDALFSSRHPAAARSDKGFFAGQDCQPSTRRILFTMLTAAFSSRLIPRTLPCLIEARSGSWCSSRAKSTPCTAAN